MQRHRGQLAGIIAYVPLRNGLLLLLLLLLLLKLLLLLLRLLLRKLLLLLVFFRAFKIQNGRTVICSVDTYIKEPAP